jgi:hypothetical protein
MKMERMIGGSEELNKYVFLSDVIGRKGINIKAFIGIFIFGWLMAVIYVYLGKGSIGWTYVIAIIILLARVAVFEPLAGLVALLIYVVAWVHAYLIFSRYKTTARQRIDEIERQSDVTTNMVLEKGLLLFKVLGKKEASIRILDEAIQLPYGDPLLLSHAGIVMSRNNYHKEAVEFFDRALRSTEDKVLIKQIENNRAPIAKQVIRSPE